MEVVIVVLDKLATILLLTILGYVCKKRRLVSDGFSDGVSGFLVTIVIPCFAVSALQVPYSTERFLGGATVFFTCIVMHLFAMVLGLLSMRLFRIQKDSQGVWVFGCMFANIGFMGIPLMEMLFGEDGVFYATFGSLAFNLTCYTLGVVILNRFNRPEDRVKIDWVALLKAPVNLFTVIGIALFVADIRLPSAVLTATELMAASLVPLAMFYIGTVLGKFRFAEVIYEKTGYYMCLMRLIVIPILGYLILRPIISDDMLLGIVIIGLSTPVGSLAAIVAAQFGSNVDVASKYIFITTVLCAFTMPFFFLLVM